MSARYTLTFWNGDSETLRAESVTEVFNLRYDGPVTATGYTTAGAWLAIGDGTDGEAGVGYVMNDQGDQCATIRPVACSGDPATCTACEGADCQGAESGEGADFAAAHDAHMRATYAGPAETLPTTCPVDGDPLTGVYGRTYAEGGYLLIQATGDVMGPVTGHAPILLFSITNDRGESLLHAPMGGARMRHVDTWDTWADALSALRWYVNADSGKGYTHNLPVTSGARGALRDYLD